MRKITSLVAALLLSVAIFAQVPQGFSYQAVVRDAQNAIVANQDVEVTVTILQGATADAAQAVFSEKHNAKTNANGLFTLTIGSVDAANFAAINWAGGNLFLKTESKYGTATTQLLSVPFAMFAAQAGSANVDLSEYAKKTDIPASPDLSNYALKSDIPTGANLSDYAKKDTLKNFALNSSLTNNYVTKETFETYVLSGGNAESVDLTVFAKTTKLNDTLAAYTTTAKLNDTLAVYAKTTAIPTNVGAFTNDARYITETDLESRGYLTATETGVNLADYYSKTEVDSKLDDATNKLFTTENGHDFVDLGLPSGTLWATCNVGASRPEEYGGVFAWGETEEKESYTWNNYAFGILETTTYMITKYTLLNKFGLQDGRVTLESEDDAAAVVMGGEWVMPTADQWSELLDYCYFEWTNNYNNTDSAGYIVYKVKTADDKGKFNFPLTETSLTPQEPTASYSLNDVHIFLPASGGNKDHYGHGTAMKYWTSSLFQDIVGIDFEGASTCEDYTNAKAVRFSYNGKYSTTIYRANRSVAYSVRGVCVSPSTKVTTSGELKNYYTKAEVDDKFALKTNVYTKTEADSKFAQKNNVYTKTEVDALLGDMPLATVNLTIEGGSDNVGIVKFLGQEWNVNKGVQTATFKVPAYSPVFLTILLHNEDNYHYYTLKFNDEWLDSETDAFGNIYNRNIKNKVNGLMGPFPNSVNNLEIYLDYQAN